MNKNLFKYYVVKNGETMQDIAKVLKIGYPALNRKVTEKNTFKLTELRLLRQHWNLSIEEMENIFLI